MNISTIARSDAALASRGAVETIDPPCITGWVAADDPAVSPVVTLHLNGVKIGETHAGRGLEGDRGAARRGFSITVRKLWPSLGAGDHLEVHCQGQTLEIAGHGSRYVFKTPAVSTSQKLLTKVRQGWLLDRNGQIRPPLGAKPDWALQVFDLLAGLTPIVKEVTGAHLSIAYGTLLGCVREGDFIKHDDDFDSFYISSHSTPEAVTAEFARLFQAIIEAGYPVRFGAHDTNLLIVTHPSGFATIDIFYGWFNEKDELGLSYGYHGDPVRRDEAQDPPVTAVLAGHIVQIPAFSEKLLQQKYGEGWRVPDHGFRHKSKTRRTAKRYYLDKHTAENLYWNNFYARNFLTEASTFAQLVAPQLPADGLVIDIGCGSGKDTLYFAQNGLAAVGADASAQGVAGAGRLAQERNLDAQFQVVDVSQRPDLDRLFASERVRSFIDAGRPVTVYMRFFLHSIDDATEAVLFSALRDHLPTGARLSSEFRTNQDEHLPKAVKDRHFRRYMDPADFAQRLETLYGFEILSREESFGWSVYKDEDPHLCRLLAARR